MKFESKLVSRPTHFSRWTSPPWPFNSQSWARSPKQEPRSPQGLRRLALRRPPQLLYLSLVATIKSSGASPASLCSRTWPRPISALDVRTCTAGGARKSPSKIVRTESCASNRRSGAVVALMVISSSRCTWLRVLTSIRRENHFRRRVIRMCSVSFAKMKAHIPTSTPCRFSSAEAMGAQSRNATDALPRPMSVS